MFILVSGGSASGKSGFAESLVAASPIQNRVYLATMRVWDTESEARVARHRDMRADKGFDTLERPEHLVGTALPLGCAVLLEDLPNLAANEIYGDTGRIGAYERVLAGLEHLKKSAALTVVVTGELFSDGVTYDPDTMDYLNCLARLNRAAADMADTVYEVVCGIPIIWKGERT